MGINRNAALSKRIAAPDFQPAGIKVQRLAAWWSRRQFLRTAGAAVAGVASAVNYGWGSTLSQARNGDNMLTIQLNVQRVSIVSTRSFEDVVSRLEAAIGHPEMATFRKDMTAAQTPTELETVVNGAIGPSGLMEFTRFDLGEVLRKELGDKAHKCLRLVAGNPLIMKEMVKHVPDAGSYAPVTILVDERSDGVHLSYDRMASILASFENEDALKVARALDAKVEHLLEAAAS
jgi:uncharacterized protein (DUF302 family)